MTHEEAIDWVGGAVEWFALHGHEHEADHLSLAHATLVKWLLESAPRRAPLKLLPSDVEKFREFAVIDSWEGMTIVPASMLRWALMHLEAALSKGEGA